MCLFSILLAVAKGLFKHLIIIGFVLFKKKKIESVHYIFICTFKMCENYQDIALWAMSPTKNQLRHIN
jgi:hypothetical protein